MASAAGICDDKYNCRSDLSRINESVPLGKAAGVGATRRLAARTRDNGERWCADARLMNRRGVRAVAVGVDVPRSRGSWTSRAKQFEIRMTGDARGKWWS